MALFSAEDHRRVAEAIRQAEGDTAGEIVCVVAHAASDYRAIPLLWAALIALAFPWTMIRFTDFSAERIHLLQLCVFAALALALSFSPLRHRLVPRAMQRGRAHQAAHEQFHARGLSRTSGRTGMLIYVAVAERYAEILADEGISSRVDAAVWRSIIETLTDALKDGRTAEGLINAVGLCGEVLGKHCPPAQQNPDELPNRLIVL